MIIIRGDKFAFDYTPDENQVVGLALAMVEERKANELEENARALESAEQKLRLICTKIKDAIQKRDPSRYPPSLSIREEQVLEKYNSQILDELLRLQQEYNEMKPIFLNEQKINEAERTKKRKEEEKLKNESRVRWIREFGSEYLNRAVRRGYDCSRQYMKEYTAWRFPGWTLDFNRTAEYSSRVCPSERALNFLDKFEENFGKDGFEPIIVWLAAKPTSGIDEDFSWFEPQEAVMIQYENKELFYLFE